MERNPQAREMADESMVRNLAAQAAAIWPQEERLLERYQLPASARILDVGCGTGEISARLAQRFPAGQVTGVDILPASVAHARQRYGDHGDRLRFEVGDAFDLEAPDDAFDLVVCRHVTQAIPYPEQVLAQLVRVCRPGGWVHVLSEDYGMLHFAPGALDLDRLWREGVIGAATATGSDGRVGRRTWALLHALGLVELAVDYVHVDSLRVPREVFAEILRAWRDGYTQLLQERSRLAPEEVVPLFDAAIAAALDPAQYAVWHLPILGGRKPA